MDDWKSAVDNQLAQLHTDIRMLLGGSVGVELALLAAIGGLYLHTDSHSTELRRQISEVRVSQAKAQGDAEARDARVNGKVDVLLERIK